MGSYSRVKCCSCPGDPPTVALLLLYIGKHDSVIESHTPAGLVLHMIKKCAGVSSVAYLTTIYYKQMCSHAIPPIAPCGIILKYAKQLAN